MGRGAWTHVHIGTHTRVYVQPHTYTSHTGFPQDTNLSHWLAKKKKKWMSESHFKIFKKKNVERMKFKNTYGTTENKPYVKDGWNSQWSISNL